MNVTRTQAARILGVGLILAVGYGIYEQVTLMQAAETLLQMFRAIAETDPDNFGGLAMSDDVMAMTFMDWLPIVGSFAVELGAAWWLLTYKPAPTFTQPQYGVLPMPYQVQPQQWGAPPNPQFGEPR